MKHIDDSFSISRPMCRLVPHRLRSGEVYLDGDVVLPQGTVGVLIQGDSDPMTNLDFAWKGRLYIRTFPGKAYSRRGVVRKAREFVEEITQ